MPERHPPQPRSLVATMHVLPGDGRLYEVPIPMTVWVAEQLVAAKDEAWWGLIAYIHDMIDDERKKRATA